MESSKGYKSWCCANHSSRVTQLQYQLQELSVRECRARHHNQKLLQDFQRAQNTLNDLVARSEAMNTIRIEYERFLEENYAKWQQKLQEKRLSEEQKMLEQHRKTCPLHTEEEGQRIGSKQNMQGNIQNFMHSCFPSTWLTQSLSPVTELEHGISKNSKNTQNVHQVLNSHLLDRKLLSGDPIVLQDLNSGDYLWQYPSSWASGCGQREESLTDCPSCSYLPSINGDEVRREETRRQKKQEATSNTQGDEHQMQKLRKKVNSSDTVNISTYYEETSEDSGLYTKAVKSIPPKVQRKRNMRKEEKHTHNTRKDAVSEGSSSVSDSQSVSNHKKQKRKEQSNERRTVLKTSEAAVNSSKQLVKENKDDGNPIDGTLTSICCEVKTEGIKGFEENTVEEEKLLRPREMQVNKVTIRDSTENLGIRANMCEEWDKKGKVEERYRANSSTDEDTPEEEPLKSDTSVKESRVLDEVDSVRESEEEKEGVGEEKEEDELKEHEDEKSRDSVSDPEGIYSEVLKLGSEGSIQDSLRELYKDDTEDDLAENEENIEQEEEEEEEEEEEDDDVIIEKSSPRTCHLAAEDFKYQNDDDDDDDDDNDDDDDDDIEGLLAPENYYLQHQADKKEQILKSKGLPRNSEVDVRGKDELVDTGDEFDHFYD